MGGLFEPDCPCKPGTPGCEIPDGPCDNVAEKKAKKTIKKGKSPMWANFNCETFWYDGGDCDELNESAVNVQLISKTVTSAPALAVGALAVVALVAAKARRNQ